MCDDSDRNTIKASVEWVSPPTETPVFTPLPRNISPSLGYRSLVAVSCAYKRAEN